mmetsp:Transcript_34693/g.78319  ORF Transcript_34693/g.78319 Transcript_34693/m.78319 type:complete len:349 (-) Transcript_34693:362-1408(-)
MAQLVGCSSSCSHNHQRIELRAALNPRNCVYDDLADTQDAMVHPRGQGLLEQAHISLLACSRHPLRWTGGVASPLLLEAAHRLCWRAEDPAEDEVAGDHQAGPALPSLAVHRDGVLTVPRHPGAGLLAHEDELREEGGRVVFEGNALNLVEEQLGVVVAHHAVGRVVGVAEVEDEELAVVPLGQKARDDVNVVAEGRVSSKRWSRHGDHPVGDVGQVQVVAMLLVSPLVLRHRLPELLVDSSTQHPRPPHCHQDAYESHDHRDPRKDSQACRSVFRRLEATGHPALSFEDVLGDQHTSAQPNDNKIKDVPHVCPKSHALRDLPQRELEEEERHDCKVDGRLPGLLGVR